MNSTIGIMVADGTFYPVLESTKPGRKRLVLTTVNDDQESVHIKIYKSQDEKNSNCQYIGDFFVKNIPLQKKGEPGIELILGIDEDGNLSVEAGPPNSKTYQSMKINLNPLNAENADDDDFDFDLDIKDDEFDYTESKEFLENISDSEDRYTLDDDTYDDDLDQLFDDEPSLDQSDMDSDFSSDDDIDYDEDDSSQEENEMDNRRNPIAIIVLVLLLIAIFGFGVFLVYKSFQADKIPPLESNAVIDKEIAVSTPDVYQQKEDVEPVDEIIPDFDEDEIFANETNEPLLSVNTEPTSDNTRSRNSENVVDVDKLSTGEGGGVWYRLRWGDNLWDLSSSFYRTPLLFKLIAYENKINDPDKIYAGKDILIPKN